jgi:hypothetical protein
VHAALRLTVFDHSILPIILGDGANDWSWNRIDFMKEDMMRSTRGSQNCLFRKDCRFRPYGELFKGNRFHQLDDNGGVRQNGEWKGKAR